jgi:hypothetical protein
VHADRVMLVSGQELGRERHQDDRQQPDHVQVPQPRVGPPGVLEDVMVLFPGGGDGNEADQE